MARNFRRHSYGRIYVDKEENIPRVKEIIRQMDDIEADYLPPDFITTYSKALQTRPTEKFDDLDLDELTFRCYKAGIFIWAFDAGHYPEKNYEI